MYTLSVPRDEAMTGTKQTYTSPTYQRQRKNRKSLATACPVPTMSSTTKWSILTLSLISTVVATPLSTYPHVVPSQNTPLSLAPLHAFDHPHGTVNNSYIVMLKDGVSAQLKTNHFNLLKGVHSENPLHGEEGGIRHVYDGHISGYSGIFSEHVVERLRTMPEVEYIEKDQIVQAYDIQKGAPWGLARISHRRKLGFSTFSKYEYDADGGDGVDVYIIDTGINIDHVEFGGRAHWGKTVPMNDLDIDGNGHGTHCAGTIASKKYGVAKQANVIAVKVLGTNGSGTMSDVVAGVAWAATSASAKAKAAEEEFRATGKTAHKGSVANMSLGGGKSRALDDTVNKAVAGGLHFAVAAGNDNKDACNYSPAGAQDAVTVGASTLGDDRAYFSNHGACVDVFAPGLNILSTYIGDETATAILSGTSMASPHTAGLLAYLLSLYPSATFDPVFDKDDNLLSLTQPLAAAPVTQAAFFTSEIYGKARSILPSWVRVFMPAPAIVEEVLENVAPVPGRKTLSPLQLKKALLDLSSSGLLADLPPQTVNKLIFNNFTST